MPRSSWLAGLIYHMEPKTETNKEKIETTTDTLCGMWYLPHNWVHYDGHGHFSMCMCEIALFLLPVWNL